MLYIINFDAMSCCLL